LVDLGWMVVNGHLVKTKKGDEVKVMGRTVNLWPELTRKIAPK
jgi:hypothetical protein